MDKLKAKLKALWKWLRKEVLNKQMLLWVIIAEALFWSPVIVCGILGVIFNSWFYTVCAAYVGFWSMPLTPAIPIQIGFAIGLKKLWEKVFKKRKKEVQPDDTNAQSDLHSDTGDEERPEEEAAESDELGDTRADTEMP